MPEIIMNLLSAFAISMAISAMAMVKSQKAKSILYTLPFPITIALIGSESVATSLSIIGLTLAGVFLWGCYYLHFKLKVNILVADILLAFLYIAAAYIITRSINVSFEVIITFFLILWIFLIYTFRGRTFKYTSKKPSKTNPLVKAAIIFTVAYLLLSAHHYLAAFVVTFPYNGVFAVYENRAALLPQAALFVRNSIALASFFTANYIIGFDHSDTTRYAVSWLTFGITIILANKFIKIKVKDTRTKA